MYSREGDVFRVLGNVIRERRQARGWTVETLAFRTGLGERTVRRMERGETFSRRTLERIADALCTTPRDLLREACG